MPAFMANGDSVKIYPDAAHGFLLRHHAEFAADIDELLTVGSS
jgi:hypothetical protein